VLFQRPREAIRIEPPVCARSENGVRLSLLEIETLRHRRQRAEADASSVIGEEISFGNFALNDKFDWARFLCEFRHGGTPSSVCGFAIRENFPWRPLRRRRKPALIQPVMEYITRDTAGDEKLESNSPWSSLSTRGLTVEVWAMPVPLRYRRGVLNERSLHGVANGRNGCRISGFQGQKEYARASSAAASVECKLR
jgi:hypothetical protein